MADVSAGDCRCLRWLTCLQVTEVSEVSLGEWGVWCVWGVWGVWGVWSVFRWLSRIPRAGWSLRGHRVQGAAGGRRPQDRNWSVHAGWYRCCLRCLRWLRCLQVPEVSVGDWGDWYDWGVWGVYRCLRYLQVSVYRCLRCPQVSVGDWGVLGDWDVLGDWLFVPLNQSVTVSEVSVGDCRWLRCLQVTEVSVGDCRCLQDTYRHLQTPQAPQSPADTSVTQDTYSHLQKPQSPADTYTHHRHLHHYINVLSLHYLWLLNEEVADKSKDGTYMYDRGGYEQIIRKWFATIQQPVITED